MDSLPDKLRFEKDIRESLSPDYGPYPSPRKKVVCRGTLNQGALDLRNALVGLNGFVLKGPVPTANDEIVRARGVTISAVAGRPDDLRCPVAGLFVEVSALAPGAAVPGGSGALSSAAGGLSVPSNPACA